MRAPRLSRTRAAVMATAMLVGGCSFGPYDVDRLAGAAPPDSAFLAALSREYAVLGDAERAEYDWRDTARFYGRALDAADGIRVEPEALEERDLSAELRDALASARERLTLGLRLAARATTPAATARAQAAFDCWMQEQEEGHQADHIADCRERFEVAMAEVEEGLGGAVVVLLADADGAVGAVDLRSERGAVALDTLRASAVIVTSGATPTAAGPLGDQDVLEIFARALGAEPPPPVLVRLYFETGTDRLTAESEAALPSVLELIRGRAVPGVEIAGHTDRVGSAAVNDRLALRRAELVRQAVQALGVPSRLMRVDSFGERDPVVPTADGVDEPRNRRVEVTVR